MLSVCFAIPVLSYLHHQPKPLLSIISPSLPRPYTKMGRFLDLALVLLTAHASFGRAQLDAVCPECLQNPPTNPHLCAGN